MAHRTRVSKVKASAAAVAEEKDLVKIGADLQAAREKRGYSIERLAMLTGIPACRLKKFEKNSGSITIGELVKIAMSTDSQFVMEFDESHTEGIMPDKSICEKCSDKCSCGQPVDCGDGDPLMIRIIGRKVPATCLFYLEQMIAAGENSYDGANKTKPESGR
jgi:transcriptional regulator with XRE-family HTH domain